MSGTKLLNRLGQHVCILGFVILYIFLALGTYKDYGLTWDEPVNYNRGVIAYSQIFNKIVIRPFVFNKTNGSEDIYNRKQSFHSDLKVPYDMLYDFCCYSGFYPMILFMLNKDKIIDRYHLLNSLFALPVFIAIYFIFLKEYRNQFIAFLGPVLLFLTPRFIGNIPANPKDVPFAVIYLISCTAIYCMASRKKSLTKILLLGLLFGIAQNLRTAAVTLYALLFIFDMYNHHLEKPEDTGGWKHWARFFPEELQSIVLTGMVALLFSLLTWPFLGINITARLNEILAIDRSVKWNEPVMYQGTLVEATKLPGSYFTTWFAITTPLMILIPALLSPFLLKKQFHNRLFMLSLLVITINSAAYLLVRPIAYDGVRLFLFMVPALVSLGLIAIIEYLSLIKKRIVTFIVGLLLCINAALVVKTMISLHPYQYIYFNALVGGLQGAYKNYDTEYWGASYNEAINWFKENIATDKDKTYKIHIGGINYNVYQAKNIINVSPDEADYIFMFTRGMTTIPEKEESLKVIERQGVPLAFIFIKK
jgi:hypothetical protein